MKDAFMKAAAAAALLCLCSAQAPAIRPAAANMESEALWLRIFPTKGGSVYIEVSKDGSAMLFQNMKAGIITRKGNINQRSIKDLFQEVDNLDVFDSGQDALRSMILAEKKPDAMELSAYWKGELRTARADMSAFTSGFRYALGEVRKETDKMPQWSGLVRLLTVTPMTDKEIGTYQETYRRQLSFPFIETASLEKVKPLARAILRPYRLIPIENEETLQQLFALLVETKVKTDRQSFYIETSRGKYKCELFQPNRQ